MKSGSSGKIPTDIYFILEHKTEGKVKVFIQILKYMCFVWEEDINTNKPPRIILPIIFYHGKEKWRVPGSFVEQFDVDEEVKRFLLDFRYILFDTNPWDFRDESNQELRDNAFLFTALVLILAYISHTQKIDRKQLKKMLEESQINGGESIDELMYWRIGLKNSKIQPDHFFRFHNLRLSCPGMVALFFVDK